MCFRTLLHRLQISSGSYRIRCRWSIDIQNISISMQVVMVLRMETTKGAVQVNAFIKLKKKSLCGVEAVVHFKRHFFNLISNQIFGRQAPYFSQLPGLQNERQGRKWFKIPNDCRLKTTYPCLLHTLLMKNWKPEVELF